MNKQKKKKKKTKAEASAEFSAAWLFHYDRIWDTAYKHLRNTHLKK